MTTHVATIHWQRNGDPFEAGQYSRGHRWEFDGGAVVEASASPAVVPLPQSVAENVDPEEAFVAALSSCHMLFFLSIAAKRRFVVDKYIDKACGMMTTDERGYMSITSVILEPKITFSGNRRPTGEQVDKMHQRSHEMCFLANSVRTEIEIRVPA